MGHPFTMSQYVSDNSLKQDEKANKLAAGVGAYAGLGFLVNKATFGTADIAIGKIGREYKKSKIISLLESAGRTVEPIKEQQVRSGFITGSGSTVNKTAPDPWKIKVTAPGGRVEVIDTSDYFGDTQIQSVADAMNYAFLGLTGQEQVPLRPAYKLAYDVGQFTGIYKGVGKKVQSAVSKVPLKSIGIANVPAIASTTATAGSASLLQELSQGFAQDEKIKWKDVITTTALAASFSIVAGVPGEIKNAFYVRDLINKNPAILSALTADEVNTVISASKAFANNTRFVATGKGPAGLAEDAWNKVYQKPLEKISAKMVAAAESSGIRPDYTAGQLAIDEIAKAGNVNLLTGPKRVITLSNENKLLRSKALITPNNKEPLLIIPAHKEAAVLTKSDPLMKLEESSKILSQITDMSPDEVRHYTTDYAAKIAKNTVVPRKGKYNAIIDASPFKVHHYLTPRWYAHRQMGIDNILESTVTGVNNRNYLEKKIQPFINNLDKYLKKETSFMERVKSKVTNIPVDNIQRFSAMMDQYEWAPDFMSAEDSKMFNDTRSLFRFFIDSANVGRVQAGREPILAMDNYLPHYMDVITEAALDKNLPTISKGLKNIADSVPSGPFNRSAIRRQTHAKLTKHFNNNLPELLKLNMHYHLTDFYVTSPYNDLKVGLGKLEELTIDGKKLIPPTTANEIGKWMTYDVMKWQTDLSASIDESLKPVTKNINKVLNKFNRHLESPSQAFSSMFRSGIVYGALGGDPSLFVRNTMQTGLLTTFFRYRDVSNGSSYMLPHIASDGDKKWVTRWPEITHPETGESINMKKFLDSTNWYQSAIGHATEQDSAQANWLWENYKKVIMAPMSSSHRGNVNRAALTAYHHHKRMVAWSKDPSTSLYKTAVQHTNVQLDHEAKRLAKFRKVDKKERKQFIENYKKKNFQKVLDSKLWHENELEDSMHDGVRLTQWDYGWNGMPIVARGDTGRTLNSLNSWWENWWTVHAAEAFHRTVTGETSSGKVIEPSARLRAFKSLGMLGGLYQAARIAGLGAVGYAAKSLLFPTPNGAPPAAKMANDLAIMSTSEDERAREQAKRDFSYNYQLFIPGYKGFKSFKDFTSGEKSLKDTLIRKIDEDDL